MKYGLENAKILPNGNIGRVMPLNISFNFSFTEKQKKVSVCSGTFFAILFRPYFKNSCGVKTLISPLSGKSLIFCVKNASHLEITAI